MKKSNYFKRVLAMAAIMLLTGFTGWSQVTVVATAGVMGPTPYTDLASAFAAINAGTHQGDIGIGISVSTTETGPCVLNASGAGPAIYTTVLIQPVIDGVSISGPTTNGRGLIELNGADNVTIDGDNPNTPGTNRNLTIQNTAANTTTYTSVVRVALSTLVTTGDNNIVRNCIIAGSATARNVPAATSTTGSEHTTYGILVGGGASTVATTNAPNAITSVTTTVGAGITALNFIASNNAIDACARGIAVMGSATTVATPLTITGNVIGNATPLSTTTVYSRGITIMGFDNATIADNTIQNMGFYPSTAMGGIWIGESSANGNGVIIERNFINNAINNAAGTYGAYGINLVGGNGHIIRNNFVQGVNHNMSGGAAFSTTFGIHGIRIVSGTGHFIYYNSVNMHGTRLGTAATSLLSSAFTIVGTGQTGCTVQNNIFANTMTGGTTNVAAVSMYLPSGGSSAMNLTLNNNFYYSGTTVGQSGILQVSTTYSAANLYTAANFIQGSTTPATNSRAYTSALSVAGTNDNASWASSVAAPFISNSDLHINNVAPNVADVDARALVIGSITTDIDNAARDITTPDIGADEFVQPVCSGSLGGTITPATYTTCGGLTQVLTSAGATAGSGITYQWQVSTTSGGPYSNVVGGSGANTTSYTTGALTAGTYYYVLQVTCSTGPSTGYSNEATVTVNPAPAVTATPATATFCLGGAVVPLTAGGATTYTWSPGAGLSSTTGANVDASPLASTTYTVTGTDGNGCTSTATAAITVAPGVNVNSLVSNPAAVCSGGNATLTTSASANVTYCQPVYTNGTGFGDYVSLVQLNTINNATVGAPSPYYTLFPASGSTTTTLVAGSTYTITLSPGTYTINDLAAWIDFNQNGTLNDGGEKLGETDNLGAAPATTAFTFTVPVGAYNGTTRLRVRDVDHGTTNDMDPCAAQSSFGETEDYIITIVGGVDYVNYAWTPATFLNMTTGDTVMGSGMTSTTTYTLTATSLNGCSDMDSVTVTVNPLPVITASATQDTICAGDSTTLTAGGANTYAWMPGSLSGTSVTVAPSSTTVYTVAGTDGNGCIDSTTFQVVVNTLPVVTLSGNGSLCTGDSTLLTGSSGGTSQWYMNGVAIPGATSNTYTATAAGIYNMTKTNLNGCADSAATGITVVINPVPVFALANDTTFCSGGMTTLLAPAGGYNYLWSDSSVNSSLTVMTSGTYWLTVTDSVTGCDASDSMTVTVNAAAVFTLGSDISACSNNIPVSLNGPAGAFSYLWSDSSTNDSLWVSTAGTYSLMVTDSISGCSWSDSVAVTVNPAPSFTLGNDTAVCSASGPVMLSAPAGSYSYLWSDNSTGSSISVSATGNYALTVTDSITGCSWIDSIAVTVNANPVVNLGSDSTICATSLMLNGPSGPYMYLWSDSTANQDLTVSVSGTYALTVTDSLTGCSSTDSVAVILNTPPTVTFVLADNTLCVDDMAATMTATPAGGGFSGVAITGNTFNPAVAGVGSHIITYSYTDPNNGCMVAVADTFIVSACVGLGEISNIASGINVFPNPNNGSFVLTIDQADFRELTIELMSLEGKRVYSDMITNVSGQFVKQIDMNDLANGTYYLRLTTESNTVVKKVVRNK